MAVRPKKDTVVKKAAKKGKTVKKVTNSSVDADAEKSFAAYGCIKSSIEIRNGSCEEYY